MPINHIDLGKHKNVLHLQFGNGDIMFCNARAVDRDVDNQMLFVQGTPHPIGTFFHDLKGKSTEELTNLQVMFEFDNVKSLESLIGAFESLKNSMTKA